MLVSASVVGAQTVPETVPTAPPAITLASIPGGHNLVIYREHAEPMAWSPTVKVDGHKIVAIPNKHYTSTRVEPGRHTVTLTWPLISTQRGTSMEIDVKDDGVVHYVEVVGVSRYDGYYVTLGSGIGEVKPEFAASLISKCCRYKASK